LYGVRILPSPPRQFLIGMTRVVIVYDMTSIFADNFPLISTQQELDSLKEKYPSCDEYYVASGSISERREKFDRLYQKYQPYADRHFLSEVRKQFHQRTWEMYLGCTLLERGIPISSKDEGPDFLIENEKKIWVECIACTKGSDSSDDRVPPMAYGVVQSIPEDEMCLRLVSALYKKFDAYKTYLKKGLVAESDIFIIAVNSGDFGYLADGVIPLILKCLFDIGYPTISVPIGGGESKHGWSRREYIEKKNGSKVPMDFFLDAVHKGISGVLYDGNNILNHTEILGKDIIRVNNPIAKNPFPKDVLGFLQGYHFDPSALEWSLKLS